MTTKKKVQLYVFYSGEWKPTVEGFVRLANERKKGETLDKTISVDIDQLPEKQRAEVWDQVMPDSETIEVGTLIYNMRIYRAVCQKLEVFTRETYIPFNPDDLEISDKSLLDLFFKTVEDIFGPSAAAAQRRKLSPAKELPEKQLEKIESNLPKLQPIKLPASGKTPSVKEIIGNYVMLVLTIHSIGNRRKVSSDAVSDTAEEADKEWLAVSKRLLESDELRDINYTANKCRQFVENRSLPSLVKKGIYILNRASVEECVARVVEDNAKIDTQADVLLRAWPVLMTEAKKRLKKRFNEADYPNPSELKSRFFIDYQLLEIKPPEAEKMSDKIFKQEKAKWEKLWTDAAQNADQLLTAGMVEQMNLLIDRLSGGEDGKPKQIRETALDNINEFLSTFSPRNMQSNQQLEALAKRAKEIISGVSPEVLRQSKNARAYVTNGFTQIKKALEPMIEKKPVRAISLDDE